METMTVKPNHPKVGPVKAADINMKLKKPLNIQGPKDMKVHPTSGQYIKFHVGEGYNDECVIMPGIIWVSRKPNVWVRFWQKLLLGWSWR